MNLTTKEENRQQDQIKPWKPWRINFIGGFTQICLPNMGIGGALIPIASLAHTHPVVAMHRGCETENIVQG